MMEENQLLNFLNDKQKENIKSFPLNSRLKNPLIEQYIKKNIEKDYGYKGPFIGKGILYIGTYFKKQKGIIKAVDKDALRFLIDNSIFPDNLDNLTSEKHDTLLYLKRLLEGEKKIKSKAKKKTVVKKSRNNLSYLKPNPLHISLLRTLIKNKDESKGGTLPYNVNAYVSDNYQYYDNGDIDTPDSGLEA